MKLFAVKWKRLEGGKGKYCITDKMCTQSIGDRKFLLLPKKKGDLCTEL